MVEQTTTTPVPTKNKSPKGINEKEWVKFQEALASEGYSLNTQKTYLLWVNDFFKTQTFTQENIQAYLRNHPHSCIKSAFKAFLRFKPVQGIVLPVQRGRKDRKIVKSIKIEDVNAIFERLSGLELLCCYIMYKTGLRISEVVNLTYENVDLRNKTLRGMGKGNVEFKCEIDDWISESIQQEFMSKKKNSRESKIFPFSRFRMNYVLKQLDNVLEHHVSPHQFRHTFATLLRKSGFALDEIQNIMRHKSISTTQMYAEVDREKLGERLRDLWGEPLKKPDEVKSEIEYVEDDGMSGS